ncbi:MAG TPA: peptidoglycan bridge formation glycyltransferase FemA/FemB family protein [Aggregatilineales bacterium]|nr:peptidoglycan bridge formation glycyltransferase FemA/FemB family protein [Aggregatilineales bacterium]
MQYDTISAAEGQRWNAFVNQHPDAHILQQAEWGMLKSAFGWQHEILAVGQDAASPIEAGALILYRRLPFGLGTMAYIPAGPLLRDDAVNPANDLLWSAIDGQARRRRAAFLKVEPCNWYRERPALAAYLASAGLRISPQTIQPPRTSILATGDGEEAVLKRMNQSTRRKVRMADKNGIAVREGTRADVASFNGLMMQTGDRDVFGVHAPAYYEKVYDLFAHDGRCALLMAAHEGQDLAGVFALHGGENAYYFYGASSNEQRNLMASYIVQWEAIRWAMAHGARRYDLWGIPDHEETVLEAEFEDRKGGHDGLWGVYGFKRGFGGHVVRSVGAWDRVYNPLVYRLYTLYLGRR